MCEIEKIIFFLNSLLTDWLFLSVKKTGTQQGLEMRILMGSRGSYIAETFVGKNIITGDLPPPQDNGGLFFKVMIVFIHNI